MIETWNVTIPELSGDTPRRAYLYLPDSWEEDHSLRYPVLYMFDGHNVFFDEDATYGKSWGMLEYMDGTRTQLIIAAVECSHDPENGRLSEYSPFSWRTPETGAVKGRGKLTMDWLTGVFKPQIDREYPTLPGRESTFIAGSSMGGLMSLYAVARYNKVFSRCAALSPSLWLGGQEAERMLRSSRMRAGTVVYMDYGSREMGARSKMAERFRSMAALLLEKRVFLTCRIVPGGSHCEASWERQIPFFMDTLLYGLQGG